MEYILTNKPIIINNKTYNRYLNCFDILSDNINVSKYYDILNKCEPYHINNLLDFINIKWSKMVYLINIEYKENKYTNKELKKRDGINETINEFINNDQVLAIFIINSIHKFFK